MTFYGNHSETLSVVSNVTATVTGVSDHDGTLIIHWRRNLWGDVGNDSGDDESGPTYDPSGTGKCNGRSLSLNSKYIDHHVPIRGSSISFSPWTVHYVLWENIPEEEYSLPQNDTN